MIKKIKTIYGYVSFAKGNTFLNYFKLKSNVISLIMDKNKFKIDNYSPGGLIKNCTSRYFKNSSTRLYFDFGLEYKDEDY